MSKKSSRKTNMGKKGSRKSNPSGAGALFGHAGMGLIGFFGQGASSNGLAMGLMKLSKWLKAHPALTLWFANGTTAMIWVILARVLGGMIKSKKYKDLPTSFTILVIIRSIVDAIQATTLKFSGKGGQFARRIAGLQIKGLPAAGTTQQQPPAQQGGTRPPAQQGGSSAGQQTMTGQADLNSLAKKQVAYVTDKNGFITAEGQEVTNLYTLQVGSRYYLLAGNNPGVLLVDPQGNPWYQDKDGKVNLTGHAEMYGTQAQFIEQLKSMQNDPNAKLWDDPSLSGGHHGMGLRYYDFVPSTLHGGMGAHQSPTRGRGSSNPYGPPMF